MDFARNHHPGRPHARPERLVILGNPKSGTALLAAAPTVGLDLPLKALVWEDAEGVTWLAYNDPALCGLRATRCRTMSREHQGAAALVAEAAAAS